MEKEIVCQFLNEALAGRTVTCAAIELVTCEVHGEVYIAHLVLDSMLKVELAIAQRSQNVDFYASAHAIGRFVGEKVSEVHLIAGDDFPSEVVLRPGAMEGLFIRSVKFSDSGKESIINMALCSAGLQVPYHVVADDEDKDDEES